MKILKFPLVRHGTTSFTTGEHTLNVQPPKILAVGKDALNILCVWVEAIPGDGYRSVFQSVFTGEDVPDPNHFKYIGTVGLLNNELIIHVYQWFEHINRGV